MCLSTVDDTGCVYRNISNRKRQFFPEENTAERIEPIANVFMRKDVFGEEGLQ